MNEFLISFKKTWATIVIHIGLFRQKFGKKEQVLHMDFEAKCGYEKKHHSHNYKIRKMNVGATCKVGFVQMFSHGHAMNLIVNEFMIDAFQISTSSTQVCQDICYLHNVIF